MVNVETGANGDSRSTYERGPSLVGSFGLSWWFQRFLSCLGCSRRPSTKLFSRRTLFHFTPFVPITQHAGQAIVPCQLSRNMCLWCHTVITVGLLGWSMNDRSRVGGPWIFSNIERLSVRPIFLQIPEGCFTYTVHTVYVQYIVFLENQTSRSQNVDFPMSTLQCIT